MQRDYDSTYHSDFGDFGASEDDEPVFEDLAVILKRISGAADTKLQRGSDKGPGQPAAHSAATTRPAPSSFNFSVDSLSRMQRNLNITPSQWEGMQAWLNDDSEESTVDAPEPERRVYRTTPHGKTCASGQPQTSSGQASSEQRCAQSCALKPPGRRVAIVSAAERRLRGDRESRELRPVVGVFRRLNSPE
ncbi:hypothetical protein T484DRAFT_2025927 [Baffinella frigidus]|jgi:hypothetical protein|nr:hypothetical protein T484DRAFT_1918510 [Cryptophyta sp. CCMP2293]KAJ1471859.1 hypothetical protein T484DRAFT_2025927 [Cryptophyta sp. CCMP2293]